MKFRGAVETEPVSTNTRRQLRMVAAASKCPTPAFNSIATKSAPCHARGHGAARSGCRNRARRVGSVRKPLCDILWSREFEELPAIPSTRLGRNVPFSVIHFPSRYTLAPALLSTFLRAVKIRCHASIHQKVGITSAIEVGGRQRRSTSKFCIAIISVVKDCSPLERKFCDNSAEARMKLVA